MSTPSVVYDSAQGRRPFAALRHFYEYRGLIRLLVVRDLTSRYKRSILGVWWTILNPMFQVAVYWLIFSNLFGRTELDVPFIVYLTSGILMSGYFAQGFIAAGSSIISSSSILVKVYVPSEVFALAAGLAAGVNFALSLVPLVIVQLITGVGVPLRILLLVLPAAAMLLLVTGLGLVLASIAVRFFDVLELVKVLTTMVVMLSAPFYPVSIVPDALVWVLQINPIYHFNVIMRSFAYGGYFSWTSLGVITASAIVALTIGVWVFGRSWKNIVVSL